MYFAIYKASSKVYNTKFSINSLFLCFSLVIIPS